MWINAAATAQASLIADVRSADSTILALSSCVLRAEETPLMAATLPIDAEGLAFRRSEN
jgi:hypothetical protein